MGVVGVNSAGDGGPARLRVYFCLLVLQTVDVELHQVGKQDLALPVQVLGEEGHFGELGLDLLALVPEFFEEDVVAERGDDLVGLLLGDPRVLLLQPLLELVEHAVADEEDLLLDDAAQLAAGDAAQRPRREGPAAQLALRPLPQRLHVLEHLVGLLHLLQVLQAEPVLLEDLQAAGLEQVLDIGLVAADEVDVLVLVDLADEAAACVGGRVRLRISRV